MKNKNILIILVLIIAILGIFLAVEKNIKNNKTELEKNTTPEVVNNVNEPTESEVSPVSARFYCPKNLTIDANFYYNSMKNSYVSLIFSDQRKYNLTQVISASGARYANSDESFVFWNKGDNAFIMENGVTTIDNCTTKKETTQNTETPASEKLIIKTKTDCEKNSGTWYSNDNTCEINSLSKDQCLAKGGVFNECASACRHNPEAQICTMQCVLTCSFN